MFGKRNWHRTGKATALGLALAGSIAATSHAGTQVAESSGMSEEREEYYRMEAEEIREKTRSGPANWCDHYEDALAFIEQSEDTASFAQTFYNTHTRNTVQEHDTLSEKLLSFGRCAYSELNDKKEGLHFYVWYVGGEYHDDGTYTVPEGYPRHFFDDIQSALDEYVGVLETTLNRLETSYNGVAAQLVELCETPGTSCN